MRQSLCVLLLLVGTASAGQIPSVPLVKIDPQQAAESPVWFSGVLPTSDESWGWAFSVERNYRAVVTHVAWYDEDRDGLTLPHSVGIWRDTIRDGLGLGAHANDYFPQISDNQLVAEGVVPAGTAAELVGPWRRIAIEPVVLGPGNYQVVGQNHSGSKDDLVFWVAGVISGEPVTADVSGIQLKGLSSGQPKFGAVPWGGWVAPRTDFRQIRGTITGPMLFVQIIPEPSTGLPIIVALLAMVVVVGYRRRDAQSHCRKCGSKSGFA